MKDNLENDDVKPYFGRYVGDPSKEQLSTFFQLDDFDKSIIESLKSKSTRLGFAIQLGTLRFLGAFISDPVKHVPFSVVTCIANQLNIPSKEFELYTRKQTVKKHARMIRDIYSYRLFTDEDTRKYLTRFLYKCIHEKIILPGYTTFFRFVRSVLERATQHLEEKLASIPSETDIQQLEQLLDTSIHSESGLFHLEELKQPLTESTQKEIIRGFQRLKTFQRFPVDSWSLTAIPQGKLAHYAEYVAQAKSQNIKRMSSVKRTAHLVAFITVYRTIALDEVLLALDKFYTGLFNLSVAKEKKERLRSIKDLDKSAVTLANVGDILLDPSIQDQELRNHIYRFVTKEAIESAVLTVNDLTRNKAHPIAIDTLLENYSKFKKFIKRILDFIPFEGNRYGEKTMAIWSVIREKYPKK